MTARWQIVCGTGHRTLSAAADQSWARQKMRDCARWLRDECGTLAVLSGMARGFDLWWADTIADTDGLELWACVPFDGQTARWTVADRREWERLIGLAHLQPFKVPKLPTDLTGRQVSGVVNQLLHARNSNMLTVCDAVVALWEPGRLTGGTAAALLDAVDRGLPGVHLDPVGRRVSRHLPGADQLTRHALYHRDCGHVAQFGSAVDIERHRAGLHAAGRHEWRIRPARRREERGDGCPTCRPAVHAQPGAAA